MTVSGASDHLGVDANVPQTGDDGVSAGQSAADEPLRRLATLLAASPHNLVARGERAEVYERHIRECDALATRIAPRGRWVDLGTGGGLPGLVLALRHPDTAWTLIDATAKKVAAVQEFAAVLGLENVSVVHGRAEALAHSPAHRGRYDGLVARALAPLPTLAELARGFVRAGGEIVAMKGPAASEEVSAARGAFRTLHLGVAAVEPLPSEVRETLLVRLLARGAPPTGYPRRDGVPKSDPLR